MKAVCPEKIAAVAVLSCSLAATMSSAGCVAPPPAARPEVAREDAAPSSEIQLSPYRTRLRTVTARVGGQTGTFLFDTAGGLSHVSPAFAERIGCKPWGRLTGFRMMGERMDVPKCNDVDFEMSGAKWRAPVAGVLDMMSFFPKDAPPLDGLIGLDLFAGKAITLDFEKNVLTVESPSSLSARTRGKREAKVRISRELQGAALAVSAAVGTSAGTAWFELDSGNGGTILVSKHVAPLLGLDLTKGDKPQPASFELLGGAAKVEGDTWVPDMIIDGNLGMPFLTKWIITLDLERSRMWLSPNASAGGGKAG